MPAEHDAPYVAYGAVARGELDDVAKGCCQSSRAGGRERHAKRMAADEVLRRELLELVAKAPKGPPIINRLPSSMDRELEAAEVLRQAARMYLFHKRVKTQRAKLFRPPSIVEALDERDYHLPFTESDDGGQSRLLPLCCSISTIRQHASADVALQLLLQRGLMLLFLALTLLSYPQIREHVAGDALFSDDIFMRMSVGNLPDGSVDIARLTKYEASAAVLLVLFMLLAHLGLRAAWQRAHTRTLKVEDYSVWVRGVPRLTTTRRAAQLAARVRGECARWGEVAHVTIPRSAQAGEGYNLYEVCAQCEERRAQEREAFAVYYGLHSDRASRRQQAARAKQWSRVAAASTALLAVETRLSKRHVEELDAAEAEREHFLTTGDAFVTFERPEDAARCREAQPRLASSGGGGGGAVQATVPAPTDVNWPQWGSEFSPARRRKAEGLFALLLVPSLALLLVTSWTQTWLNVRVCATSHSMRATWIGLDRWPPTLCFAINQAIGLLPGVTYGLIFSGVPAIVLRVQVHRTLSSQVKALALRLVCFQTLNMLVTPLGFLALVSRFEFSATWYRYASGPTVTGMLAGQVVAQLVMAVIDVLFLLPQAFVTLVLACRCRAVPRLYAWLNYSSPALAALLAAIPVLGKFPLDHEATVAYFTEEQPFYLGKRAAEIAIPFISAVAFGPAFPCLYALALVATVCGEAQDRVKVLRRLKRLPTQADDDLLQILTGVVFPVGILSRMALLLPIYSPKLDGNPDSVTLLKRLVCGVGAVCLVFLLANLLDMLCRTKVKPLKLRELEQMRAGDVEAGGAKSAPAYSERTGPTAGTYEPPLPRRIVTQLKMSTQGVS
jgi:hypothetical protein